MIMSQTAAVPQVIPYSNQILKIPTMVILDDIGLNDSNDINNNMIKSNKVAPKQAFVNDDKVPDNNTKGDFEVIWHKLSYTLTKLSLKSRQRLDILKSLNGFFRSSEITAILGPSGAGKSTLLEIICGRRKRGVDGEVRVRGVDDIKVGFVPQDNHLLELLTVKESFVFASKLINVRDHNFDHNGIAEKLIRRFGLQLIADTKAKNCSGGQRKRLSIALEIISKPNILILDEPTTGLDSPSCTHIIAIMRELVSNKQRPTAIVTTIHQPSVSLFDGFNSVYVLSGGGKCIYHGSPQNLVPTLYRVGIQVNQYTSPADYIIEIAAGDYGQAPIEKMALDAEGHEMESLVTAGTKTLASASRLISHPFWPHLKLLYIRTQIILYRDPLLTVLRIIMAVSSALTLNVLFGPEVGKVSGCFPRVLELYAMPLNVLAKKFESDLIMIMQNVGLLFCGLMIGFVGGIAPSLLNFPKEMQVFHKEYHNGSYSCITYYLAKVVSDIPLQIITPLIYILLTYFYSNQPLEAMRFFMLLFISILLSFLAQSIGECAGAAFMDNQNAAVFVGGLVPLPMILFGGFLVKVSRMPFYLRPLSWLSFMRFSLEGMLVNIYGFNRCEYSYRKFLSSVNASAITKPQWAESLPIMMDFVNNKKNPGLTRTKEVSDDETVERLYSVFSGAVSGNNGKGIDMNTSLILTFYELENFHLYRALAILIAWMFALKIFTYYVLLAKIHSTK